MIALFGGVKLTPGNLIKTLSRYKPGEKVAVTVERGRRKIQTSIVLGPPLVMDYRIEEMANATTEAKALRAAWMNGK
jgi:predicted metalloprotease with PDZ domain